MKKCTCGAASLGYHQHSEWCDSLKPETPSYEQSQTDSTEINGLKAFIDKNTQYGPSSGSALQFLDKVALPNKYDMVIFHGDKCPKFDDEGKAIISDESIRILVNRIAGAEHSKGYILLSELYDRRNSFLTDSFNEFLRRVAKYLGRPSDE